MLCDQVENAVEVEESEGRDDITVLEIPQDCVGYITGGERQALSSIESDYGTLMLFMGSNTHKKKNSLKRKKERKEKKEKKKILIFTN